VKLLRTLLAGGVGVLFPVVPALAQPAIQAAPVLRARDLVPPDMLTGVHFQVARI
jgi:hypothetical protein